MQTPSPPRAVPFSLLGPDGETVIIESHNDLAVARVSSRRLDRAEGEDHPCEGRPNSAAGEPRRATRNGCEDAPDAEEREPNMVSRAPQPHPPHGHSPCQ